MNIFKVLSEGDGHIAEPNVSAFLSFLLDPKQAHGLGSAFLERFLSVTLCQAPREGGYHVLPQGRGQVVSLALQSEYEVEIETEVGVLLPDSNEKGHKKRDIDVVIEVRRESHDLVEGRPSVREEFIHAIAIENKIRDEAIEGTQLQDELDGLQSTYRDEPPKDGITMVFLTPSFSARAIAAVDKFRSNLEDGATVVHLVWNPIPIGSAMDERHGGSVYNLLSELLHADHCGEIDPIHEHTKYVLKSFMSFIRSGFRSYIEEKRQERPPKDRTLFTFDGRQYQKARLPWAVVRAYVNEKCPTYEDLRRTFPETLLPKKWQFKGLVCSEAAARTVSGRRYYLKETDLLSTNDGVQVVVNNQWDLKGIQAFILHVSALGYQVS